MYVYVCLMYVLFVSRSKSEGKIDFKEEVKVWLIVICLWVRVNKWRIGNCVGECGFLYR